MASRNTTSRRRALTAIAALAPFPALGAASAAHAQMTRQRMPGWPMVPAPMAPSPGTAQREIARSRTPRPDGGIRRHGFIRDAGGTFTALDASRAGAFTLVLGVGDDGRTMGTTSAVAALVIRVSLLE